jgi:hypothetical protein
MVKICAHRYNHYKSKQIALNTSKVRYKMFFLYYDQQMHNYLTNYHGSTCFDTIVYYATFLFFRLCWEVYCER